MASRLRANQFLARCYGTVGAALAARRAGEEVVTVRRLPGAYVTTPHHRGRLDAAGLLGATWHAHAGRVVSVPAA